ncbi:hypothetical protein CKM354_001206300 [Cercospora kikuchii]|uniref:Uncharacterized protein n=1 Tax=Cercospora kikuchii TaxID=84275 RepID=A0A9P3FKN6_9PEZI|nr:uncharacterized protein CKM354_001206300 [Cercospora kikuchii]GIZ49022.1 hypothetical protein CKM354_001206300 [Cercospora kikuchii]
MLFKPLYLVSLLVAVLADLVSATPQRGPKVYAGPEVANSYARQTVSVGEKGRPVYWAQTKQLAALGRQQEDYPGVGIH